MYPRVLDLVEWTRHRSLFLLGPRLTGKSTLVKATFPNARFIDLLRADTFREYSANPELLRERMQPGTKVVVIDEVQKLPSLLDEAHGVIESDKAVRFIFTGSSARKLKRGGANLLAGRAWFARLHPLVSAELDFGSLEKRLNVGGLPQIFDSLVAKQDLAAYVGSYLHEEIRGEALTRRIEPFSRFLTVAGLGNTEPLNFTSIGNDAQVPPRTVREYYQLLEDTLVGHALPAYRKTVARKATATAKFFFFDVGVANTLARRGTVVRGSTEYGRVLEHQVLLELRAYLDYRQRDEALSYWRSLSGMEVDFVVGDRVAIEVKATGRVGPGDTKGIKALAEEVKLEKKIIVSAEREERRLDQGIVVVPIRTFFERLWADEIV